MSARKKVRRNILPRLTLSVTFFVVIVICNRALMSTLRSPFSKDSITFLLKLCPQAPFIVFPFNISIGLTLESL